MEYFCRRIVQNTGWSQELPRILLLFSPQMTADCTAVTLCLSEGSEEDWTSLVIRSWARYRTARVLEKRRQPTKHQLYRRNKKIYIFSRNVPLCCKTAVWAMKNNIIISVLTAQIVSPSAVRGKVWSKKPVSCCSSEIVILWVVHSLKKQGVYVLTVLWRICLLCCVGE
jgi:hypothetical protein